MLCKPRLLNILDQHMLIDLLIGYFIRVRPSKYNNVLHAGERASHRLFKTENNSSCHYGSYSNVGVWKGWGNCDAREVGVEQYMYQ